MSSSCTSIALLVLALVRPVPAQDSSEWLITKRSIGLVHLRQTREDVYKAYAGRVVKETTVTFPMEGGTSEALEIYGDGVLMIVEFLEGKVFRIRTSDPRFATADGLRVGMTLSSVRLRRGEPELFGFSDDGLSGYFTSGEVQIGLRFDARRNDPDEQIPPATKVDLIAVIDNAPFMRPRPK